MTMLSVIIPLAPNETVWQSLLADLTKLPDGTEILFVTSEESKLSYQKIALPNKEVLWLKSKSGRANQMNTGAKNAKGKYFWFLHADSKFGCDTLSMLLQSIQNYQKSLLYFDLAFFDASYLMFINTCGVWFRSRILKVPFGDQGFCIACDLFEHIGGFPSGLSYGEDHMFVWKARQNGIAIQSVGTKLYTSARKYRKHGWLKTTCLHQYLWIKQAWPQWIVLQKN